MQLNEIDRARPQKLYHQLMEILKEHIEKGIWKVGTQMPTEEQLCSKYNVSKATVRLALSDLALNGYLKKFQGKGTFVRRRTPGHGITMLLSFGEEDSYRSPSCISRILETGTLRPEEGIMKHLDLSGEDYCFSLSRLIIADGTPLMIERLYTPSGLISGLINDEELADMPFHALLENRCGINIRRIKEIADVSGIGLKDAGILELTPDMPVLRTIHIGYAHGDRPISFSESLWRTDAYPRIVEFERMRI